MVGKTLAKAPIEKARFIHWRGGEISRIEGFSDAVFAFAIALLVVSLEVPDTFGELQRVMFGFIGFAGCFALLVMIWYQHYLFFRQFGLEDGYTMVLNAILLFVILFYIYPLKFLSNFLIGVFFGFDRGRTVTDVITASQGISLMVIYALGYLTIFVLFSLMYIHAYRQRVALRLSEEERFWVRFTIYGFGIHIGTALLSILIVGLGGVGFMFWSGMAYALIGPFYMIYTAVMKRRLSALRAASGK